MEEGGVVTKRRRSRGEVALAAAELVQGWVHPETGLIF